MWIKKQHLEPYMEQLTGSKLGKENIKAVRCHSVYLTYLQNTSWKIPGWTNHRCNQYFKKKCQKPQIGGWYHSNGRKWRGTREPLDEGEREQWNSWLKAQHSKNEDHGFRSHHFIANRWGNNGNSDRLFFFFFSGALKSPHMVIAAMKLKDTSSLEEKL